MSDIRYQNLDQTQAHKTLKKIAKEKSLDLRNLLTSERVAAWEMPITDSLRYNYAAKLIDDEVIDALQALSNEQQLVAKYRELLNGEIINTGEKRMVLHHLVRGQLGKDIIHNDKNIGVFYRQQQDRINGFVEKVHGRLVKGSTGKPFDTVVQIGIGGSDLGPRALYLALRNYVKQNKGQAYMNAYFISNVDPDDANEVLDRVDFERTLFILVSKSGTTQETLTNETFVRERIRNAGIPGLDPSRHMVAVTSETSPLAKSSDYLDSFYIDDYIGGRFSGTSAVGGAVLALSLGPDIFEAVLKGAHEADRGALEEDIRKNPALLDALIGVWERNYLSYPTTAVLPYSQALGRFPAHLQQLDMESNGKRVNRYGEPVPYNTGPVVFGEPGTNGQHSFYQLLHQGTDIVPLQFIGFIEPQLRPDLEFQGSTSQTKLNANLVAQIVAFAKGKEDQNRNKEFPGNRPSSLICGQELTPAALGALLAHYENKIMFQGFIWNINSFDQEGVQLGKILTSKVLGAESSIDPALHSFASKMQVR